MVRGLVRRVLRARQSERHGAAQCHADADEVSDGGASIVRDADLQGKCGGKQRVQTDDSAQLCAPAVQLGVEGRKLLHALYNDPPKLHINALYNDPPKLHINALQLIALQLDVPFKREQLSGRRL